MSDIIATDKGDLERRDSRPIDLHSDDILCVCCVRNEEKKLPHFFDYHRNLGINRFFVVDNASEDGTLDFLLSQDDVHVYYTANSYAESKCGVTWVNELLRLYGVGHWVLTLDADELLVYPDCEHISLRELTRYLEQTKAKALLTFMLDMYSDGPIKDTVYKPGTPFLDLCRYFDWDTYHLRDDRKTPIRGGPRHRLFWNGAKEEKPSPVLRKFPLVKWNAKTKYEASTHIINDCEIGAVTGVLLHFKFFSEFYAQAHEEATREEHWDAAAQYKSYWNVLSKNPNLSAYHAKSKRYVNSAQLTELELMNAPPDFIKLEKTLPEGT